MRMHLCWGNYEGPHTHDIPLAKILGVALRARPSGLSFEAANPRHAHEWEDLRDAKIPDDKVLIPGVIELDHQFCRTSATDRPAHQPISPMPSAASGSSPEPIAALPPSLLSTMPWRPPSCGPSSRRSPRARASPASGCGPDPISFERVSLSGNCRSGGCGRDAPQPAPAPAPSRHRALAPNPPRCALRDTRH